MTKKERAYIEAQIAKFERWAREEDVLLSSSSSCDDEEEHYLQYRLNDCAASVLLNLLIVFDEGV